MGAMFGGGGGGGYQQPQYGPQQGYSNGGGYQQYGQPQGGGGTGPYSQQATQQTAQQQQNAMMQGFGGQQQQPMGKGGAFNAPNYAQMAGFAGGPPPGMQQQPPPQQQAQGGQGPSPPGQPGQPAWLGAAQQAARTAYDAGAQGRAGGLQGQDLADVQLLRGGTASNEQAQAANARLAQSLGDAPRDENSQGYGTNTANAINAYGAGGKNYDPQDVVRARQAAVDVRKAAGAQRRAQVLRGG